jgi:hypothetical protein
MIQTQVKVGDHVHGTINGESACGTVTAVLPEFGLGDRIYLDGGRSIIATNITMMDPTPRAREEER